MAADKHSGFYQTIFRKFHMWPLK